MNNFLDLFIDKKSYCGIKFSSIEETELFKKYIKLSENNGWEYEKKTYWEGTYSKVFTIKISIRGTNVSGKYRVREWDTSDKVEIEDGEFDALDNSNALNYLFNKAEKFNKEEKEKKKLEEFIAHERELQEYADKKLIEQIKKYSSKLDELNGIKKTNEFAPHFKILNDIENIAELNKKSFNRLEK